LYPPQPNETSPGQSDTVSTGIDPFQLDTSTAPSELSVEVLDFDLNAGFDGVDALNDLLNEDVDDTFPVTRPDWTAGKTFSTFHISPYAKSRMSYSMERMAEMPEMMVKDNSTMWCHPLLYEEDMPRSLQDAHAACALYIAKNDANSMFVSRHISERALELSSAPLPSLPIEVLARTQALLLYLIMLLFSGDIRHAGLVGDIINHIEGACPSLKALADAEVDPSGTLPLFPSAAARSAWKSFIFRESTRRTLLTAYNFCAICKLLRGRLTSCSHDLAIGNRVTFSAHLWSAKSAFAFAVAWNEKNHLLVKDLNLAPLLETARPDDIDTYGKMVMIGVMGIDDIEGWFYTRGGTL
jgi:hypothetical protein